MTLTNDICWDLKEFLFLIFLYVRRVYFASKEDEAYYNTTILQVKQCTK